MIWRPLKSDFISLDEKYAIITRNIAKPARSCIMDGHASLSIMIARLSKYARQQVMRVGTWIPGVDVQ